MKVLICERFSAHAEALLRSNQDLEVSVAKEKGNPSESELRDAEAMIIRSKTHLTPRLLKMAPNLKFVVTATSGFDHIDFEATKDLTLAYTPDANAASAAEHTLALTLSAARHIPQANEQVKTENWNRQILVGKELAGKTWGIVGFGRIGQRVAMMAISLGMKVIAFDPYQEDEVFAPFQAERKGLNELFKESDIVSVHVPSTKETKGFISKEFLADLGPEGIFVNTSRGCVVKHDSLVSALEAGDLGAAALDVFETEPPSKDLKLIKHPRVFCSPHVGASTKEALERASLHAAEAVLAFCYSQPQRAPLPPKTTWFETPYARRL